MPIIVAGSRWAGDAGRAAGWRAGTFGCGDANQAAAAGEEVFSEERDGVLSISASSLKPEGTSVSSSGLDMSVRSKSGRPAGTYGTRALIRGPARSQFAPPRRTGRPVTRQGPGGAGGARPFGGRRRVSKAFSGGGSGGFPPAQKREPKRPSCLTRETHLPYSKGGHSLLERRVLLTRQAGPPYSTGGYFLLAVPLVRVLAKLLPVSSSQKPRGLASPQLQAQKTGFCDKKFPGPGFSFLADPPE